MQFVLILSFVKPVYSGVAGGHDVGFGYCLGGCTLMMSCKFGGVWTPPPLFMSKIPFLPYPPPHFVMQGHFLLKNQLSKGGSGPPLHP